MTAPRRSPSRAQLAAASYAEGHAAGYAAGAVAMRAACVAACEAAEPPAFMMREGYANVRSGYCNAARMLAEVLAALPLPAPGGEAHDAQT